MKRADFVGHVAWTGAGILYVLGADGHRARRRGRRARRSSRSCRSATATSATPARPTPTCARTLGEAVATINAMPVQPAFVIHTGDVTHLSKATEFDDARAISEHAARAADHDPRRARRDRRAKGRSATRRRSRARTRRARGWSSWDQGGIHFVALINVGEGETMGVLGDEQLAWLAEGSRGAHDRHADRRLRARAAVRGRAGMGLDHDRRRQSDRACCSASRR